MVCLTLIIRTSANSTVNFILSLTILYTDRHKDLKWVQNRNHERKGITTICNVIDTTNQPHSPLLKLVISCYSTYYESLAIACSEYHCFHSVF